MLYLYFIDVFLVRFLPVFLLIVNNDGSYHTMGFTFFTLWSTFERIPLQRVLYLQMSLIVEDTVITFSNNCFAYDVCVIFGVNSANCASFLVFYCFFFCIYILYVYEVYLLIFPFLNCKAISKYDLNQQFIQYRAL